MSTDLKFRDRRRDPAELDKSLAYITADQVTSVHTFLIRRFDKDVWPLNGRQPSRSEVMEFIDKYKSELLRQASLRVPKPLPKLPPSSSESREDTAQDPRYAERKERLSRFSDTK